MKKIKSLLFMSCVIFSLFGCTDWLTIQPETQVTKEDMFKTQAGFYDALTGSYILMRDNYSPSGQMVLGGVEYMANLWETTEGLGVAYYYASHDYRVERVERELGNMFLKQYEIIANLNILIKYIDNQQRVLTDKEEKLYKGEALGLRAFIHFDLIRLWGPMPTQVDESYKYLPYETTVQLENYPYSNYREYMNKLCADLDSAELLLKQVDPILSAGKSSGYRPNRMNYYAVLGLQARVHLWLGEKDEALRYARMVKDATSVDGKKLFSLGSQADLNRNDRVFYASEQLFGVAIEEFDDSRIPDGFKQLTTEVDALYTIKDIRLSLWFANNGGYRSPNKYDNMASSDSQQTKAPSLSVPMIRLAEMYLIIAECADLSEANGMYKEFLASRGLVTTELTESNRKEVIQLEYLKEFYAEGQMFYVYKRLGTVTMHWGTKECGEDVYVLPLPLRELNTTENY
ncbi:MULTISPECIES: RagB/SusD family nutrient uptake outer membrane protein [Butyricimonas]|uniref:RagB/SusD family nutrient uptake outer membrane protein n=1 Tax=Butyricimonas TaxID=574697 RepID=UPI0022E14CEA|nr:MULTISPECIES: RagB/SusD family nutrient uptake outer membrane protein [Butyricimonas]